MTDQLWPDSIGLFLVKFVLTLVKEHHVNPLRSRNVLETATCISC